MYSENQIAVVVPAYNEAPRIERTLRGIPPFVDTIWVIDDASSDGTAELARQVADSRVTVLEHSKNLGVGAAIVRGYHAAFAAGADMAIVMAGDDQMDPADLPNLLHKQEHSGAGYVKGTRLRKSRGAMPLSRWVGNHLLSALTRRITHLDISDSQCGYTLLTRQAAQRLNLDTVWPRYGYPNDLLIRMAHAKIDVAEVDVQSVYRDEISGVRLFDAVVVVPFVMLRSWVSTSNAQPVNTHSDVSTRPTPERASITRHIST